MHCVLEGNLKEGKPREEKEGKRMAPVWEVLILIAHYVTTVRFHDTGQARNHNKWNHKWLQVHTHTYMYMLGNVWWLCFWWSSCINGGTGQKRNKQLVQFMVLHTLNIGQGHHHNPVVFHSSLPLFPYIFLRPSRQLFSQDIENLSFELTQSFPLVYISAIFRPWKGISYYSHAPPRLADNFHHQVLHREISLT